MLPRARVVEEENLSSTYSGLNQVNLSSYTGELIIFFSTAFCCTSYYVRTRQGVPDQLMQEQPWWLWHIDVVNVHNQHRLYIFRNDI